MNKSNPISPPSYELKTSDKGWFMQIGYRDSLTVHYLEESMDYSMLHGPCCMDHATVHAFYRPYDMVKNRSR